MQLHTLQRKTKLATKKRVGRGGKRGKTSGRGHKGQNSRAGAKKRPEERDIIKKIPKLRGRGKNLNTSAQQKPVVINLSELNDLYEKGDTVSVATLREKGIAKSNTKRAKILGKGSVSKALTVKGIEISKTAKDAIESAGGTITE